MQQYQETENDIDRFVIKVFQAIVANFFHIFQFVQNQSSLSLLLVGLDHDTMKGRRTKFNRSYLYIYISEESAK